MKWLQKCKRFCKRAFEYYLERCRSDDYYDHLLVDKLKYKYRINKQLKNIGDNWIRLEQMPIGDSMVGERGKTRCPEEVLTYKNNTTFLRFRKGNVIAIYTLKKKSDRLAYLVSEEMGPVLVKIL